MGDRIELEPDAPKGHTFPATEDALRQWAAHRVGGMLNSVGMAVSGKRASLQDVLPVGRELAELGHLGANGELTPMGWDLVTWAFGGLKRCDDRKRKSAIERLTRHLRKSGIIAPARAIPKTRRYSCPEDGLEEPNMHIVAETT